MNDTYSNGEEIMPKRKVITKQKPTLDEIKLEINDQMTMSGTFALVYKLIVDLEMDEMETLHDDLFRLARTRYTDYLK